MLIRNLRNITRPLTSFSTVAVEPQARLEDFRTNETITNNHSKQHIGKFYSISPEEKKQLFTHGGLPKSFEKQCKTFGETCLMVREPALEIMDYVKSSDLSRPSNRYVLYGNDGTGKSLTMAHLLHYGFQNDFILVHVPWVPNWFKKPKEKSNSTTQEGFIDLPFDAASWLVHFKTQNAQVLSKMDLKLSRDYVWSKRETTSAGAPISSLVEHGIARIKFATDVISALVYELKLHSTAGKCKTMVAIDGYNAFFYPKTYIFGEHKVMITSDKITIRQPFLDITKYDWCNGLCILITDKLALGDNRQESPFPRYQLGQNGFEHVDPFIPIKCEKYSEKEFHSCIDYYLDRRWIQNTEKGFDTELKHLTNSNPYQLMTYSAPL